MIEMEKCQERFVDREIPGIEDLLNINALEKIKFEDLIVENDERIEANECDAIVTKPFDESNIKATSGILFDKYKKTEATEMKNIEIKRVFSQNNKEETHDESDVVCDVCKKIFKKDNASMTVQAELRRFLDQQEAGLDSSFRCIRCRDCKDCLKGAGQERMSMIQEAQQQLIKQSVSIDKVKGRAVAELPFLTPPAGKLKNNTRIAERRLESVCKKYAKDEKVKEMINASFMKLFDNDHMVLMKNLPMKMQHKLLSADPSYTIPWDVAFKEGSLSTPARPVFDASSKTPGGESLKDILAKGQPDLVRLLDMVLAWRMGPSALTGDIRQFYNSIMLLP